MAAQRPSAGYQLALSLISVLMISLVLESLDAFWRMELAGARLFALAAGAVVYGWLWWRSPWAGLLATALGGTGVILLARRSPALVDWLVQLAAEAQELLAHLGMGEFDATFGHRLGIVMLGLVAILAGLLIIGEGFGRGSAFWSIVGGVLLFGTQWAWFFERSASFFMAFMLLALVLWTLAQAAQRDARWVAAGRRITYRSQIASPLLAIFAASLVGALLPYEFDPINLGDLGEKVQEAFPVLKQLRGGGVGSLAGRFSLAVTGFAPDMGTLGGPVMPDDRVALHVSPASPLSDTLYLRGATFLEYTGTTWEVGDSPELALGPDGTLPTQYGSGVLQDSLTVRVTPALNFGRTIFGVLEPQRVEGLQGGYEADGEANLVANRSIARNSTYTVNARLPRYSADQIRSMITGLPDSGLERYLQLPENLPERVRGLARSIGPRAASPYDQAEAIEAFLRGMTYDLDTPATPAGRDFVDFFLFDLQRGYCTYYATAMVVMLRELEIPARLVEGFALPASATYTEDASGARSYPVLNSQAHAWVEAFFPGYGWVTFDPTPRADLPLIARDTPAPAQAATPSTAPDTPSNDPNPGRQFEEDPLAMEDFGPARSAAPRREWPWFLTPILILAALGLAVARYLRAQDRFQSREARPLVQEAWEKAGGLLARFDFGRAPHQTPREYALHLGKALPPLQEQALQVAEDYTVARYGSAGEPIAPETGERAKGFWQRVRGEMFDRYGWRTYLWRRLWRGRRRKG